MNKHFLLLIGILIIIGSLFFIFLSLIADFSPVSYFLPGPLLIYGFILCLRAVRDIKLIKNGQFIPENDTLKKFSKVVGIYILIAVIASIALIFFALNSFS